MMLQILEKKWVTVLFRADGDCRVSFFFLMACFQCLFMETGESLSSFSFDSTPIPHTHVKQSFLPPTCFLGCQTPLPSEVVELSLFVTLYYA